MQQHYKNGQVIITQGARGDRSFRILEGEVLICQKTKGGRLIPIVKLGANALFGEMFLFDKKGRRTATAISVSDKVVVEVIFETEMLYQLQPLNQSAMSLIVDLTQRLHQTTGKYTEEVIKSEPDS